MCRYIQSPPISLQSAVFTINTARCAEIVCVGKDESLELMTRAVRESALCGALFS